MKSKITITGSKKKGWIIEFECLDVFLTHDELKLLQEAINKKLKV